MDYEANFSEISDETLAYMAKKVGKELSMDQEEALWLLYEEYDILEELFALHGDIDVLCKELVFTISNLYRIA
jgi:hypothetical protein